MVKRSRDQSPEGAEPLQRLTMTTTL